MGLPNVYLISPSSVKPHPNPATKKKGKHCTYSILNRVNVISNVSSGSPEKNGNDVTNHIENQDDCLAELVEAQTV
jgi:hypothetical protein